MIQYTYYRYTLRHQQGLAVSAHLIFWRYNIILLVFPLGCCMYVMLCCCLIFSKYY
jgi:hypothetical protein